MLLLVKTQHGSLQTRRRGLSLALFRPSRVTALPGRHQERLNSRVTAYLFHRDIPLAAVGLELNWKERKNKKGQGTRKQSGKRCAAPLLAPALWPPAARLPAPPCRREHLLSVIPVSGPRPSTTAAACASGTRRPPPSPGTSQHARMAAALRGCPRPHWALPAPLGTPPRPARPRQAPSGPARPR